MKLDELEPDVIPDEVKKLADQRFDLRVAKKYIEADQIRSQIEEIGYSVIDTPTETKVEPNV